MIAFPKAALFDAGYLKRQCAESIDYQCPEDGGDVERDGQNQLVCTICFRVVQPILRCGRCKEELVLGSKGKEGIEERDCLSAHAYDKGNGNALPTFAPADETLWAFRTSPLASIQVATETALRNMCARGELTEAAEVISPQHDAFKLAKGSSEFGTALKAGLILSAKRAEQQRLEQQRLKQQRLEKERAEQLKSELVEVESQSNLQKNESVASSASQEFKTSIVDDAIFAAKRVNPMKSENNTLKYVLGVFVLLVFVLYHFRVELTTTITKLSSPPASVQSTSQPQTQLSTAQANATAEIKFDNGNVYLGKVKNGKPNEQGTLTYARGDRYVGDFIDGLRDGHGIFTQANGDRYIGEFKNDVRSGQGTLIWASGGSYAGEWKNNKWNGQGTFISKDGTKIVGLFKDDMYVGSQANSQPLPQRPSQPVLPTADKLVQDVQTVLNQKGFNAGPADGFMGPQTQAAIIAAQRVLGVAVNGLPSEALVLALQQQQGAVAAVRSQSPQPQTSVDVEIKFDNGDFYFGKVKNGVPDGQGSYIESNGTRYVGEFKNGSRSGEGTLTETDGSRYVGEWKDNSFNGQGSLTGSDGTRYVGQLKDNRFHGQGTLTLKDGTRYVGQFQDSQFHGQGTFTTTDGNRYVGEFKDNQLNGRGSLITKEGITIVGTWKDGKHVGP